MRSAHSTSYASALPHGGTGSPTARSAAAPMVASSTGAIRAAPEVSRALLDHVAAGIPRRLDADGDFELSACDGPSPAGWGAGRSA